MRFRREKPSGLRPPDIMKIYVGPEDHQASEAALFARERYGDGNFQIFVSQNPAAESEREGGLYYHSSRDKEAQLSYAQEPATSPARQRLRSRQP